MDLRRLLLATALCGAATLAAAQTYPVTLPSHVIVDSCAGCGGSTTADASAFTFGTTIVSPLGAVVDDTATNSVAEDSVGTPRMSSTRVLYVDLKQTQANTTAIKVDGSAVTQPVSGTVTANAGTGTFTVSGTVTANAGTGTFTNQQSNITADYDTGAGTQTQTMFGVALPASGGAVAGGTSTNPLRMDPTGTTTQPVSGTVTANIGTTNGLALDASVTGLQVAQASTTSGQKGPLTQGAVTTAAPSYTTGQTSPLSLTTTGALRVDNSAVTQPVNVAQIAGTTTVTAAAGVQKVGLVGNAGAAVDAAHNGTAPANVLAIGLEARSSTPTAGTNGNVIRSSGDLAGNQYQVLPIAWSCNQQALAATLTQCQAAPGAGYSLYVTGWIALTTTTTAGTYRLAYGTGTNCGTGTTALYPAPGLSGGTRTITAPISTAAPHNINLGPTGIKVPAANAMCVVGVATNTIDIVVMGYTAP